MPITNFMANSGGLNTSASPLFIKDNQATGQSYNYDYATTGAITKVLSPTLLNAIADTQLITLGLGQYHDVVSDTKTLIRAAGTKIQTVSTTTGVIVSLTDDTVTAKSNFLTSTTQPVVFSAFNTLAGGTQLWMAGGGLPNLVGYYGSKVTNNGVAIPAGGVTPVINTHSGGTWVAAGTFYYGIQFRKLSTQTYSNVSLDVAATTVNLDDTVTLPFSGITNIDSTLYDQIIVWRSNFAGVSGFTTGQVIAQLASTATQYIDTGSSITSVSNTPRAGNTILDNSQLATGTYKSVTAFKRRLVTAVNSTIYLSDLNKPESWPLVNSITIPTGGPITALSVIGVPSEYTTGADNYLCIWKERELWILTGSSITDWSLLFVDKTGSTGQSSVVAFNGFVSWLSYNGIFIWAGTGLPSRVSRPILNLWNADGDLDKTKLYQAVGCQFEKGSQVLWRVSHRTKGNNKVFIKMDTRLTSVSASENLQNPEMDGTFILDYDSNSYYGLCSFRPSNYDEKIISGDDKGFVYTMFSSATSAVSFDYETRPLDMGHPERMKRFKRVIVYVEKLTNNDLSLYYWTDYRVRDEYKSVVKASLLPSKGTQPALYDVALFDQAYFDDYVAEISPLEFHLHSYENNAEGLSLKIRFEQLEASAPVRIHGFSIEWEDQSNLTIATQQV